MNITTFEIKGYEYQYKVTVFVALQDVLKTKLNYM